MTIAVREYLKDPNSCLYCGSDEIVGHELDAETFYAYRDVTCTVCKKEWTEQFELKNIILEDEHETTN